MKLPSEGEVLHLSARFFSHPSSPQGPFGIFSSPLCLSAAKF